MTASAAPSVTFWGAARTVTGSMHLLQTGRSRILLDCGLYQGKRAESYQRNSQFPFKPAEIDAVFLSHAHIDHCGNLPNLVRQGFGGPIYCTPATRDLAAVMLADSAKIAQEDADFINRHRDKSQPAVRPLYEPGDVFRTLRQCDPVPYDRIFDTRLGVQLRFVEAGHLLGSAMVALTVDGPGGQRMLTFTGDLGRPGLPILRDPAPVPPAELLISESTYGDRDHPPVEEMAPALGDVVRRTAARGGRLLIPAFSLGRTQTVLYYLFELMRGHQLPELPIFVDSPLAADATEVFRLHPECFDEPTALLLEDEPDLFGGRRVHYTRTVEESKQLNNRTDPCIIIAASGMCETGRIVHHLVHGIEDPRNTIALVGYQAPETLGSRLAEGRKEVRIHDRTWKVRAEVVMLSSFSSHAGRSDLLAYLGPLTGQVKKVRLVHGEPEQAEALARALQERGYRDVAVPARGETASW